MRPDRNAAPKIPVCLGFDGSDSEDWTCIRAESIDGFMFTPTFGPGDGKRPTIWNPAEAPNHRIPRGDVHVAVAEIFTTWAVERFYCDPFGWSTEIEGWALEYGTEHVFEWDTGRGNSRVTAVHAALERFRIDLSTGALTHDDCPITAVHMANTRKIPKPGERYVIGKPNEAQKIDAAMTSVLCHEAACDARAAGWAPPAPRAMTVVRR